MTHWSYSKYGEIRPVDLEKQFRTPCTHVLKTLDNNSNYLKYVSDEYIDGMFVVHFCESSKLTKKQTRTVSWGW